MKKIVIYINSMNAAGGIERVVSGLMHAWQNKYHLILLTKDDGTSYYPLPENIKKISLHAPLELDMHNRAQRIASSLCSLAKSSAGLRRIWKRLDYDFIYVPSPLNALEAYCSGAECGKLIVSEHASAGSFNRAYEAAKRFVYPKARCISVPNKRDVAVYKGWGCRTAYIPHLVPFKAEAENSLDTKILLNVGRLTPDKRQGLLLEIWSGIHDKNGWKLYIVGDGEEKDALEAFIGKMGIWDSVRMLPARRDIETLYRQASLFAFTSRWEGFGMVLLEAMSFGIPCISFDCPSGPGDIVKDGQNGFLIENGDADGYAKRLRELLAMDAKELKKLGEGAFRTVRNWDNDKIIRKWDLLFAAGHG